MTNTFPVDTLYYATVVTRDAKATAKNYAQFYGIDRWTVVHYTPDRLTNSTIHGRVPTSPPQVGVSGPNPVPGEYGFLAATGTNSTGAVRFQLVQPTSGLSTFEEFLITRGPGVHSVFMSVVDRDAFALLKAWLAEERIPVGQSFTFRDVADYYYFDAREALGGYYLQVVVPRRSDWEQAIAPDEEWDFSKEISRPPSVEAVTRVSSITHFGVVVPDVVKRVETYARLFGQPIWRGMHWRTEPGSLDDTTYYGKPVSHAYFTGRADIGQKQGAPFGFEIVQPTFGPTHYKEDFLQVLGPGIHHIDLNIPLEEWHEWDALNQWLAEEMDAPTCMSGWLRNHTVLFHYQDTRKKLGYVTEIHPPVDTTKPRVRWAPDYWYDFTGAVRS